MVEKIWEEPTFEVMSVEMMDAIVSNVLTVESSLYASGCHSGMHILC